jgi:hypothetical protein
VIATIAGALKMKRTAGPRPRDARGIPSSSPPSPTAARPSRIASRQATKTKYVMASSARTTGAPKPAITSPANAGPMSPEMLNESDSIAFAVVRSSLATSRVMSVGIPAPLVMKSRP